MSQCSPWTNGKPSSVRPTVVIVHQNTKTSSPTPQAHSAPSVSVSVHPVNPVNLVVSARGVPSATPFSQNSDRLSAPGANHPPPTPSSSSVLVQPPRLLPPPLPSQPRLSASSPVPFLPPPLSAPRLSARGLLSYPLYIVRQKATFLAKLTLGLLRIYLDQSLRLTSPPPTPATLVVLTRLFA